MVHRAELVRHALAVESELQVQVRLLGTFVRNLETQKPTHVTIDRLDTIVDRVVRQLQHGKRESPTDEHPIARAEHRSQSKATLDSRQQVKLQVAEQAHTTRESEGTSEDRPPLEVAVRSMVLFFLILFRMH